MMEPPESPQVAVVGGVLSRGEDTDGERTDDEVDFPSGPSYVSQHQDAGRFSKHRPVPSSSMCIDVR